MFGLAESFFPLSIRWLMLDGRLDIRVVWLLA